MNGRDDDIGSDSWPRLDLPDCLETSNTLQLCAQIVGKTRLALSPMTNHWWQTPFYLSARGLTTSAIPAGSRAFDAEIDFIAHQLVLRTSDGGLEAMSLGAGGSSLADFHREYLDRLARLGIELTIQPFSVEMPERVRLDGDTRPRRYDREWASRFFRVLVRVDQLLQSFRGRFIGKCSPVHFFWGGFDLAVTRFSGRRAPPHPGGVPHVGDWVMREAYSHEVSSAGFWPGDARFPEAAFYSYAYPEPPGFKDAPIQPAAARYLPSLGEFVLPYAAVRSSPDPSGDVMSFLESTYAAAARLAGWNRADLERFDEGGGGLPGQSSGSRSERSGVPPAGSRA
jgi:hypothetical protein